VVALPERSKRRQRRLSVAAAAFIVVGGSAGVAAAAENSLPGDPLYPIKRGIESAQVSFSSSDSGKGQDLLRQASTRLDEVDGLMQDHASSHRIDSTLAAFQKSAADGADLIFADYQRNGDSAGIERLQAVLGSQLHQLDGLSHDAPSGSRSSFDDARSLIGDLSQQAGVLCPDCSGSHTALATSAPDLVSLLAAPAEQAHAAGAKGDTKLSHAAEQIAKNTPFPSIARTPGPGGVVPSTTQPSPSLPLPSTSAADQVPGALTGVSNGVTQLLQELTQPLTSTLGNTLGGLGKGLTPPTSTPGTTTK
jgi:hypothetical protein